MDALTFYDVDNQVLTAALTFGTAAPSSSDDISLRVVNISDQHQAQDVVITIEGAGKSQLFVSLDGDTFTASVDVGDIAPGATSLPFWVRRVTPGDVTGDCTATLTATPAGWTTAFDPSNSDNIPLDTES